ncbi:MAG: hypothetical protein V9E81_10995 [Marmoricola sp.]
MPRPDERCNAALPKADLITLLSRHEVEIYLEAGFSAEQLFPITYGVSHTFYTPDDSVRDISVLAVGQDRGRDYRTLFDAVSGTDLVLDVVCKPENLTGISIPDNVRIHGTVSHVEYRSLLRRAQILAVPTIEMAYPTGSSVALKRLQRVVALSPAHSCHGRLHRPRDRGRSGARWRQ